MADKNTKNISVQFDTKGEIGVGLHRSPTVVQKHCYSMGYINNLVCSSIKIEPELDTDSKEHVLDHTDNDHLECKDINLKTEHVELALYEETNKNIELDIIKKDVNERDLGYESKIKLEDSKEIKIEKIDNCVDVKWITENKELNIKEDETIMDEERRTSPELVEQQQHKEGASSGTNVCAAYFTCNQCDFKTTSETVFKSHQKREREEMFKCNLCEFKTFYHYKFTWHMVKHGKQDHKCDQCTFQTKYIRNLNRHMLVHNNSCDVTTYKCDREWCDFKTIHTASINRHMAKHGNTDMYKCYLCSYQTDKKPFFARHIISHKNSDDNIIYKCNECDFQSLYKRNLNYHSLKHKNLDEVHWYKCDQCDYQTVRKQHIKRHLVKHGIKTKNKALYKGVSECYQNHN